MNFGLAFALLLLPFFYKLELLTVEKNYGLTKWRFGQNKFSRGGAQWF